MSCGDLPLQLDSVDEQNVAIQDIGAINAVAGFSTLCKYDETVLKPCSLGLTRMKLPSQRGDDCWKLLHDDSSRSLAYSWSRGKPCETANHARWEQQQSSTSVLHSSGHPLMNVAGNKDNWEEAFLESEPFVRTHDKS